MKRSLLETSLQCARRSKWVRVLAVLPVAAALTFGPGGLASATRSYAAPPPPVPPYCDPSLDPYCAPPDNDQGGNLQLPPDQNTLSPDEQNTLNQKMNLANKYAQVRAGTYDSATFNNEYSAFLTNAGEVSSQHQVADRTASCDLCSTNQTSMDPDMTGQNYNASLTSNLERNFVWNEPQVAQVTSFYCGPATAYEMLAGLNATRSYYGEQLGSSYNGQHLLARNNYLQTDSSQGTNWQGFPMSHSLNRWRTGSSTGFYVPIGLYTTPVTYGNFKVSLLIDIDAGYPLAANVVELGNEGAANHLDQHPYRLNGNYIDIYHWVAVRGYYNYGDSTYYVDSVYGASTISWSSLVTKANHGIPTSTMVNMVSRRGFVW